MDRKRELQIMPYSTAAVELRREQELTRTYLRRLKPGQGALPSAKENMIR